jgi:hypothetical protein
MRDHGYGISVLAAPDHEPLAIEMRMFDPLSFERAAFRPPLVRRAPHGIARSISYAVVRLSDFRFDL